MPRARCSLLISTRARCISTAQATARAGSSGAASGAPKNARIPSPWNSSTVPLYLVMISTIGSRKRFTTSITSAGARREEKRGEPPEIRNEKRHLAHLAAELQAIGRVQEFIHYLLADVAPEGVADEIALLQALDHALERSGQTAHLVVAPLRGKRDVEVTLAHFFRRGRQVSEQAQHSR